MTYTFKYLAAKGLIRRQQNCFRKLKTEKCCSTWLFHVLHGRLDNKNRCRLVETLLILFQISYLEQIIQNFTSLLVWIIYQKLGGSLKHIKCNINSGFFLLSKKKIYIHVYSLCQKDLQIIGNAIYQQNNIQGPKMHDKFIMINNNIQFQEWLQPNFTRSKPPGQTYYVDGQSKDLQVYLLFFCLSCLHIYVEFLFEKVHWVDL